MDEPQDPGVPADSPPASETPSARVPALEEMSASQRDAFWKTGDLPTTDATSLPAETDAATPVDRAASTDAIDKTAASEPAAPAKEKPPKNLKTRGPEVDAEIAELKTKLEIKKQLQRELAAIDRQPSREAKAPESQPKRYDGTDPNDPKPAQDDFASYPEYLDARDEWNDRKRERLAQFGQRVAQQQQHLRTRVETFEKVAKDAVERITAYEAEHPDVVFDPVLLNTPMVTQLRSQDRVQPINVIVEEILKSPVVGDLLAYFSTPDGKQKRAELEQMGPAECLRALGRIEARFESRDTASAQAPSPKTVSTAPEPLTTVGRKQSSVSDPQADAIARGDYAAWEKLEDEKVLKAARR